jgi:hypothetical protein
MIHFSHTFDVPEQERIYRARDQRHMWATSRGGHQFQRCKGGVMPSRDMNLVGAAGEFASHIWLGVKWRGDFFYEGGRGCVDLGKDVEVKTSRCDISLLIPLDDPIHRRYICVWLNGWTAHIQGWANWDEAMQDRWRKDPVGNREAYFYPASLLRPLSTWVRTESGLLVPDTPCVSDNGRAGTVRHPPLHVLWAE